MKEKNKMMRQEAEVDIIAEPIAEPQDNSIGSNQSACEEVNITDDSLGITIASKSKVLDADILMLMCFDYFKKIKDLRVNNKGRDYLQ